MLFSRQNTRRPLLPALAFLIFAGICAHGQLPVNVTLNPRKPGAEIPAGFVGLSFEMSRVLANGDGGHFFSANNAALAATFKTLGIKNLRVGGNTADRAGVAVPSKADVDNLFAFAKAAGVKVIFTLRLNHGDPAADAEMAAHIFRYHSEQLDCFAIGNEPNVFFTNFDSYLAEWKRFAAVIHSRVPDAKFCGPSVSPGHEKWSAQFAAAEAGTGWLKFISQHDYPGGDARKFADAAPAAREKILSPAMGAHYAKFAANFVPAVLARGLPYRFEEANSFYDGGALDASDTFASALWALNYQWWWAAHGLGGINFHTGDQVAARDANKSCRYATFWTTPDGYNIHPIGYAEKMFSLGSRGKLIPAKIAAESTNLALAAYAVLGDDKIIYVTLINSSHGESATNFSVRISANDFNGWRDGELLRLTAPDGDVSTKIGVTLGGAEITDNARWAGRWEEFTVDEETPVTVGLPAASAVVVKLTPKQ